MTARRKDVELCGIRAGLVFLKLDVIKARYKILKNLRESTILSKDWDDEASQCRKSILAAKTLAQNLLDLESIYRDDAKVCVMRHAIAQDHMGVPILTEGYVQFAYDMARDFLIRLELQTRDIVEQDRDAEQPDTWWLLEEEIGGADVDHERIADVFVFVCEELQLEDFDFSRLHSRANREAIEATNTLPAPQTSDDSTPKVAKKNRTPDELRDRLNNAVMERVKANKPPFQKITELCAAADVGHNTATAREFWSWHRSKVVEANKTPKVQSLHDGLGEGDEALKELLGDGTWEDFGEKQKSEEWASGAPTRRQL